MRGGTRSRECGAEWKMGCGKRKWKEREQETKRENEKRKEKAE